MRARLVVLFVVTLAFASQAFSASVADCAQGTIADYIGLGATGCMIDDKVFSNFTYIGSGSGGAAAIPASGVSVTPLLVPYNPGLLFNAAWSVGPGQTLDSMINYTVAVLPGGNPITDISTTISGFATEPDGLVTVAETTSAGNLPLVSPDVRSFARLEITPTLGPIEVHKDIAVNGNHGFAAVSGVTNQFSEAPEPATSALLGTALLSLGFLARRRRKA